MRENEALRLLKKQQMNLTGLIVTTSRDKEVAEQDVANLAVRLEEYSLAAADVSRAIDLLEKS